ncbi:MAG: hypothetical protein QME07_05060 [bacterium]|nr:hypothetical protein [bacterium]
MEIEPISCFETQLEEEDSDDGAIMAREDMLTTPKRLEDQDAEVEEIVLRKEEKGGVLKIILFFRLKSLGIVSVQLTKEIGQLHCSVKCEDSSAASHIKENLPLLSAMLGIAKIDVVLAKNICKQFKIDIEV